MSKISIISPKGKKLSLSWEIYVGRKTSANCLSLVQQVLPLIFVASRTPLEQFTAKKDKKILFRPFTISYSEEMKGFDCGSLSRCLLYFYYYFYLSIFLSRSFFTRRWE